MTPAAWGTGVSNDGVMGGDWDGEVRAWELETREDVGGPGKTRIRNTGAHRRGEGFVFSSKSGLGLRRPGRV